MRRGFKFLAILAILASAGLAAQSAFASCVDPDGTDAIVQCGLRAWFNPPPAGSGAVKGAWWQVGFGNAQRARSNLATTTEVGQDGSAWVASAGTCTVGTCTNGTCTTGPVIGADCSANGNLDCGQCATGTVGSRCTVAGNCTGFIGNDSGLRVNDPNAAFPPIDLTPGDAPGGAGGPPGALCFGSTANWKTNGSDGCADNPRTGLTDAIKPGVPGFCNVVDVCDTGTNLCAIGGNDCATNGDADCTQLFCTGGLTPGGACSVDADCGTTPPTVCNGLKNDDRLNKYWGPCLGQGTSSLEYLTDAPMGALLTESNKKYFALDFFANTSRGGNASDDSLGDFSMDSIGRSPQVTNRGDANPIPAKLGAFDIIPWQVIPGPGTDPNFVASATLAVDPNFALLTASWSAVRLVDDGSIRPTTDSTTLASGCTGVGVRDCGALVRYVVQSATAVATTGTCSGGDAVPGYPNPGTCSGDARPCSTNADCQTCGAFSNVTGGAVSVPSVSSLSIARDRCVRVRTIFGKVPATVTSSVTEASNGRMGDVGYQVDSGTLVLGKSLVSANAVLKVAAKNKNAVLIEFDTTGELDVTGFDTVGKDAKGERVIGQVSCTACSTGRGAHYSTVIPAGDVRGSKSVVIVTQPSGARSNELPIQ